MMAVMRGIKNRDQFSTANARIATDHGVRLALDDCIWLKSRARRLHE